MSLSCWITKATDRHSEHVILTAFPLQQWLRERSSMLRYTCIPYLIFPYSSVTVPLVVPSNYAVPPVTFLNVCSEPLQKFVLNINMYVLQHNWAGRWTCSLFSSLLSYPFFFCRSLLRVPRFFLYSMHSFLFSFYLFHSASFFFSYFHLSFKACFFRAFFANSLFSSFISWKIQFFLYY